MPRGHLAESHLHNDAYVEDLHRAYGLEPPPEPTTTVAPGGPLGPVARSRPTPSFAPTMASASSASTPTSASAAAVRFGTSGDDDAVGLARLGSAWARGPRDPAGELVTVSHRPVLCSALDRRRNRVAIGSSDHAVYEVDVATAAVARTLFTKRYGHTEWVTALAYLPDGSLASAAMDAKICLWSPTGVRCADLVGHSGSIAALTVLRGAVVSAGYDSTVRVWDATSGSQTASLAGHKGPVLCVSVDPSSSRGVSGGRDQLACAWDFETGARIGRMAGHRGHVTAARWLGPSATHEDGTGGGDLFATGAQDGNVRVWDLRQRRAVAAVPAHVVEGEGAGAVGDLGVADSEAAGGIGLDIVSAAADRAVCVLDSRRGFAVRHRLTEHKDFIYSLRVAGRLALSGAGDGALIAHDVVLGRPLWALGANEAAVRCVELCSAGLVASGDDGCALVYRVA